MFYPQLTAGPIERPQNMLHQFHEEHKFDTQNLLSGFRLMLWGFFKKLVIADRLAQYVNIVYASPGHFHYLNLVIGMFFFGIQIYCDFSGYSDIALGSARVMGFKLMTNFNRPFLYSTNITEFWRRWHISLYTWFTDYLYTPLVIALRNYGKAGIVTALMTTFFLSGLWHGANWIFAIFGLLHGTALVYEMFTKKVRKKLSKKIPTFLYRNMSILITFIVVNIIWIFFRANSVSDAILIVRHIFTLYHQAPFQTVVSDMIARTEFVKFSLLVGVMMTVFMLVVESRLSVDLSELDEKPGIDYVLGSFVLISIILLGVFNGSSFIYFQF